ncbi:MAG: cobalamin-independent methionine synthase II family protein [Burkholderiales bacterium]
MKGSTTRILTTHAGSLPRPPELVDLQVRVSRGEIVAPAALAFAIRKATQRAVEQQLDIGIDIGNDGEQPRESFFTYVRYRMSGFSGTSARPALRDLDMFPAVRAQVQARSQPSLVLAPPRATGAVRYLDRLPLDRDLDAFSLLLLQKAASFGETFWTAPSPGIIGSAMQNDFYGSLEEYINAVADALRTEYEAIVARGHILQIDAPDLAMERHRLFADRPLGDFLGFVDIVINALNRALANIPRDRIRLHVCWGNYEGPHTLDVALEDLLPHLFSARVGGLVLSMANPRHAHEHRILAKLGFPRDWTLVVGVIDTTTNYVEHPEVVADRLELAAKAVGDPRRVLAGTDCGFDTSTGCGCVADEVVWEKLRALRAGADLATARLF